MPTTKQTVTELLDSLSAIFSKEINQTLIDSYWISLRDCDQQDVIEAGYRCMDECNYFPKPVEIKARIKAVATTKNDQDLQDRFTCPRCKNRVSMIIDNECWECHNSIPFSSGRTPAVRIQYTIDMDRVMMQERTMCNQCHRIGDCFRDAIDEPWRCVPCYTGLTSSEIKSKFRALDIIVTGKTKLLKTTGRAVFRPLSGDKVLDVDPNEEFRRKEFLHQQAEQLRKERKP